MKKKIICFGILSMFLLTSISYVSALETNTVKTNDNEVSIKIYAFIDNNGNNVLDEGDEFPIGKSVHIDIYYPIDYMLDPIQRSYSCENSESGVRVSLKTIKYSFQANAHDFSNLMKCSGAITHQINENDMEVYIPMSEKPKFYLKIIGPENVEKGEQVEFTFEVGNAEVLIDSYLERLQSSRKDQYDTEQFYIRFFGNYGLEGRRWNNGDGPTNFSLPYSSTVNTIKTSKDSCRFMYTGEYTIDVNLGLMNREYKKISWIDDGEIDDDSDEMKVKVSRSTGVKDRSLIFPILQNIFVKFLNQFQFFQHIQRLLNLQNLNDLRWGK
jgi:hypothetical protein